MKSRRPAVALPLRLTRPASALCSLGAVLLLSACGSTPHRTDTSSRTEHTPQATSKPTQASSKPVGRVPVKKGGGYYKDDGPGEDAPDNLEDIPDAIPRREPLHKFANRPYNVFGINYTPATRLGPYAEEGNASWYGKKFHGVQTSSGERYDMFGMTAAHPTLPIPSYARVTNLDNGKSVVVRINDRGPFHPGRVIDLTYTAAWKLGYVDIGTARVRVDAALPDDLSPAEQVAIAKPAPVRVAPLESAPLTPKREIGGVFLQLGAFSTRANAESLRDHAARELGDLANKLVVVEADGKFKLKLGPFTSADNARQQANTVADRLGMRPFVATN